jgi:hypothetical protein
VCGALELLMTVSVWPAGTVTSVAPKELVLVIVIDGPSPVLSAALSAALSLAAMLWAVVAVAAGAELEPVLAHALAASTRLAMPAPSASRRRMGSVFNMRKPLSMLGGRIVGATGRPVQAAR